jgi:predicted  nucleic acid-binding Zn-ribbon protein
MKKQSGLPKTIIAIIAAGALVIGLTTGLGVSNMHSKKEQKVFEDKIKEANRKIVFLQKMMTEEKAESTASVEQKCQGDQDKLDKLQNEKRTLGVQLEKLKEQMQGLEMKAKELDEVSAKAKKLELKVKESTEASAKSTKDLQEMERNNKDLDRELKKTKEEKQALETELKKKTEDLGHCEANNAELCVIAEELINKYRNKGLGAVIAQKEPLTQIKKVELEKIIQQYQEEIDQLKVKKKEARRENATK